MSSKIEKKDLKTIYRRYLALNSMNDYPGQMHNGYTFSLLPVLDKIYKDNKEERIKAKKRHMSNWRYAISCTIKNSGHLTCNYYGSSWKCICTNFILINL